MQHIEEIRKNIVHSAIKVHKALGPGLLESVYQKCLAYELEKTGLNVACEVSISRIPSKLECGFHETRHKTNGEQSEGVICC